MGRLSAVQLQALIHVIRGKRVMLDSDLARLYGVPTKALNQAVRRNRARFPGDFMFALSREEAGNWRSQFVTSNSGAKMGLRWVPHAFTEQGVAMLSSVLRTPRAVAVNISIVRAFVRYKETLSMNAELAEKFRQLAGRLDRHDREIGAIMDAIRGMIEGPRLEKKEIGFRPGV